MQLNLKTKSVRFELVDDEQETTITLSSDDDQETICRKLRRVLSLTEPARDVNNAPVTLENMFAERAKRERRERQGVPEGEIRAAVTGNGWAKYAKPEVPEHLKGEVEMIEEGEQ